MTHFKKHQKTLLIGAVCLGAIGLGLIWARPNNDKMTIVPTAKADVGVLKMSEVLPKPQLVRYVSIENTKITPQEKQKILKQINNIQETGSSTGGVLTTEFKQSTHAKMTYRFGRKQPLSFQAVKMMSFLPQGFVLTGRQYEGQKGEQGFDGIYQLFENPTTKSRLEITQTKLAHETILIKELFNENVDGTPIRLESLSDKQGNMYYHGEFVLGETYVVMNAKGMNLPEFMAVIIGLLSQPR
ncbi:hypothetical protein [Moraxella oblonga]|uniref:hypothetical protein n=1 Tax=Moraxella oblonga TaxID=200413 RepID=UPI00082E22ED|nr:hypothetical protein [Moraxella oblonga]